jgi:magnesium-transporting ATPase (P-type)
MKYFIFIVDLFCFAAFSTAKGELVRSILYPKPVDFKFNTDTYRYVGGMALIALGGMIFSLVLRVRDRIYQIIQMNILFF